MAQAGRARVANAPGPTQRLAGRQLRACGLRHEDDRVGTVVALMACDEEPASMLQQAAELALRAREARDVGELVDVFPAVLGKTISRRRFHRTFG